MCEQPLVSVLVVTWNRRQELAKSLESVITQTYPRYELVVVDNDSTDGSSDMVRERFPQALLISSHKNLGCPSGRNLGFANCRGKYVYMLDDDGWLEQDALEKAVARAESDADLGVIMTQIREIEGETLVRCRPAGLSEPLYVSSFTGCCSMIRRDIFEKIGGFPDDFFRQGEEEDFAIRMLDAGKFCFFEPSSIMYHRPSPINRNVTTFVYYSLRNTQKTVLRHWPFPYNVLRIARTHLYACKWAMTRGQVLWPAKLLGNLIGDLVTLRKYRKPVRVSTVRIFRRLQACPSATHPGDTP